MKNKTIIIDDIEYILVPKSKNEKLNDKYKIKFEKSYTEKHFDVKVFGLYKVGGINVWTLFRRTERDNGSFYWTDWSTGGVTVRKNMVLLLEKWYQEYKK